MNGRFLGQNEKKQLKKNKKKRIEASYSRYKGIRADFFFVFDPEQEQYNFLWQVKYEWSVFGSKRKKKQLKKNKKKNRGIVFEI